MDQCVIETTKRLYRKQLLRRLLLADEHDEETFLSVYKKINLKDCCYMLVEAWNSVNSRTLMRAWNKLLKRSRGTENDETENEVLNILETITNVEIFADCDKQDINEWLHVDTTDPGFQVLTDDEIVQNVIQEENNENEKEQDEEMEGESSHEEHGPSHAEAFQALDLAFKWFERQQESDPIQLLHLKRVRDLAAVKRRTNLKQTSISYFFHPVHRS